jgi:hypothetical protein
MKCLLTILGEKKCVDITFVDPHDERLEEVNESNCFNSNQITFADVYTITTRAPGGANLTSGAEETFYYFSRNRGRSWLSYAGLLPAAVVGGSLWMLL